MNAAAQRPNPAAVLATLKDFQRRTVEHVHHRFYLDDEPTSKFLVADEVGLGKTLVARGVTVLALEELWESTERIDVVYICSNAEIAQQNINRLRVIEGLDYAKPTRLSLLPLEIAGLKERKLNFVSLTPGTSFETHSAMGRSDEREVLYGMLHDAWGLEGKRPFNIFCADARRDPFERRAKQLIRNRRFDDDLWERFITDLSKHERALREAGSDGLRERFEALLEPFARRQRPQIDDVEVRDAQRLLIGELRAILARSCVDALEPDLVILDEFQRFKHLLREDSEAGELANALFAYHDADTGQPARTLLLSATPYKAYATSSEADDAGHYEDFIRTVAFLFDDASKVDELRVLLNEYRRLILRWGAEDGERRLREVKRRVEELLQRSMARTERLAESADRNGMLEERTPAGLQLRAADIHVYRSMQAVAGALEQHDTMEYWKSSPYLLNLMDGYKLKRDLVDAVEAGAAHPASELLASELASQAAGLLDWDEIEAYEELDPGNARMRALAEETLGRAAWKLLWIPPCVPYYELEGPYREPSAQGLTKRLVFSSWAVVPKAISLILSYIAEREMARAFDSEAKNTASERKNRGSLLRVGVDSDDRLIGMPIVALTYPSFALAEAGDPATLADGTGSLSRDDALELVVERLSGPIAELTAGVSGSGRVDERWYWAMPLMLDGQADAELTRAWLEMRRLPQEWAADTRDDGGTHWPAHIQAAAEAARGELELGVVPEDLCEVTARLALAAPGVAALRALTRGAEGEQPLCDPERRISAAQIAWGFRTLFNLPEVAELIRGLHRHGTFWREALRYCVDGCLQAVLDEYVHVQREALGHVAGPTTPKIAAEVAEKVRDAVSIRTTRASVDLIESDGKTVSVRRERMRARFALRFGDQTGDDGAVLARSDHVRTAFNSPFWPFVLASTSVGQEGLDFHLYSHAVVHWNLPSNPVDLEQREGRVHRYKGHAVRKNVAAEHGARVLAEASGDPWGQMFSYAEADRPEGQSELWPFWIYAPSNGDRKPAVIERHVPALPLSRDRQRLGELRHSLTLYRSVLGQARQEDLLELLAEKVGAEDRERVAALLRIDLTPPVRPPLEIADRPTSAAVQPDPRDGGEPDEEMWEGPREVPSPLRHVQEQWPAYADMPLDSVREAFESGSALFRELLVFLARNPAKPQRFKTIEATLDWKQSRLAGIIGGYSNRAKQRWDRRRPFHAGTDDEGNWWIWVDDEVAGVVARSQEG